MSLGGLGRDDGLGLKRFTEKTNGVKRAGWTALGCWKRAAWTRIRVCSFVLDIYF